MKDSERCTTHSLVYLVLVDRVDDAVIVQDNHVRVSNVKRDVTDSARSAQPLDRQVLRQFLGERRVLAIGNVVLDNLMIGVRDNKKMR